MSEFINKAKKLAFEYHKDQRDRAGKPYLDHLKTVADGLSIKDEDHICVAWLQLAKYKNNPYFTFQLSRG